MTPIVRHLLIHDKVQSVYYRQSMVDEAQRLGITGWMRNLVDGSVQAMVCGDPEQVQAMIARGHKGPAAAMLDKALATEATGTYALFDVSFS